MLRLPSSDINSSHPKSRVSALRAAGDAEAVVGDHHVQGKAGSPQFESLLAQTPDGQRWSKVWGELQLRPC